MSVQQYITTESLKNYLGPDGFSNLESVALDYGANFLNGNVTSAFKGLTTTSGMQALTVGAADVIGGIGGAKTAISQDTIIGLASSLTNMAVSTFTKESTKIVGDAIAKIIKLPSLDDIISEAGSKIQSYVVTFGEAVKKAGFNTEDLKKSQDEKNKKSKFDNVIKRVHDTVGNINEYVSTYTEMINTYIETVTTYIYEGPDWVTQQLNHGIDSGVQFIKKQVDKKLENIEKEKQDYIDKETDKLAYNAAQVINDLQDKAIMKAKHKIENGKSKALAKAFSKIQKSKLKIMSITGINIPV